jgi:hypothetical protein
LFGAAASILLASSACNSETVSGVGGLAFEATASVVAPPAQNVRVIEKITNISTGPIDVQYSCLWAVFHTGSLDGPVVYDPRATIDCAAILVTKTLDPDGVLTLQTNAVPGLRPGEYFVEAVLKVNGENTSVGAGTVTF